MRFRLESYSKFYVYRVDGYRLPWSGRVAIKRYSRDVGFFNTGEVRGRRWMEVLMYAIKAIVCIYVG